MVGAGPAGLVGRAHRGPFRRPGGAAGRPARGRRVAARHGGAHRRPAGAGVGGRRGGRAGHLPRGPGTPAHHRLRLLRRRLRPGARAAHRPPRLRGARAPVPAAGLAAAGRGRSWWPPARTSDRWCSRTTTVPGIMLAASARTYLHRYGVLLRPPGRGVHDQRQRVRRRRRPLRRRGRGGRHRRRAGGGARALGRGVRAARDRGAHPAGGDRHERGVARHPCARRRAGRRQARASAPGSGATCCWSPAAGTPPCTSTARPAGGSRTTTRSGRSCPAPTSTASGVAGSARGRFTLAECLRDGAAVAARRPWRRCGARSAPGRAATPVTDEVEAGPSLTLWSVPDPAEQHRGSTQFVDLQRDASVSDILRATGAGLRSVEHVKRYTTIGTAHDQGKTSGIISSGIVADALGVSIADMGTTTFRPPYTPVSFAALAGRDRGPPARPRAGHAAARVARACRCPVRGRRAVEAPVVLPPAG